MRRFFAYIRVSTAKQGQHGVSLQEQRDFIKRFADRQQFTIVAWFEERETAAKRGRPVFDQLLRRLRNGEAEGLLVHKIDRSARNLRDWADLGELIDAGVEVQFANDNVDLRSRGGRLSADIQAVVAADYIRNLREETRKGFYGRVKQGLYPLPAPLGYTDCGKGKPKDLHPIQAPLVREAFELYATGQYGLDALVEEMYRRGLRNKRGNRVARTCISRLLNNPFYVGLIHLSRTGEVFPGAHEPIVSKSLFERVHDVLRGKVATRTQRHDYLFRRLLTCARCRYSLIGEAHKGHVYYRCHTRACRGECVREEAVEHAIIDSLARVTLADADLVCLKDLLTAVKAEWAAAHEAQESAMRLRRAAIDDRIGRLTDAMVDGVIERELFEKRKLTLLLERQELEHALVLSSDKKTAPLDRVSEFLELAKTARNLYETAIHTEKRELVKIVTSNRSANGKNVVVELRNPFRMLEKRASIPVGDPYRTTPRTGAKQLFDQLLEWFVTNPEVEWRRLEDLRERLGETANDTSLST